jgi:hypothetical protein
VEEQVQDVTYPPEGGACKGHPVDWWFPVKEPNMTHAEQRALNETTMRALRICEKCSIKEACLDYSLEWEPMGIWGGVVEAERHYIRRERKLLLKRDLRVTFDGRNLYSMRKEMKQLNAQ